MGQAHIKDVAGIIGNYEDDEPDVRYCPHCLEHGLHNILGERVYPPTKPNEPKKELPSDHDLWLQCTGRKGCGHVH
jgi:hypothetical protein